MERTNSDDNSNNDFPEIQSLAMQDEPQKQEDTSPKDSAQYEDDIWLQKLLRTRKERVRMLETLEKLEKRQDQLEKALEPLRAKVARNRRISQGIAEWKQAVHGMQSRCDQLKAEGAKLVLNLKDAHGNEFDKEKEMLNKIIKEVQKERLARLTEEEETKYREAMDKQEQAEKTEAEKLQQVHSEIDEKIASAERTIAQIYADIEGADAGLDSGKRRDENSALRARIRDMQKQAEKYEAELRDQRDESAQLERMIKAYDEKLKGDGYENDVPVQVDDEYRKLIEFQIAKKDEEIKLTEEAIKKLGSENDRLKKTKEEKEGILEGLKQEETSIMDELKREEGPMRKRKEKIESDKARIQSLLEKNALKEKVLAEEGSKLEQEATKSFDFQHSQLMDYSSQIDKKLQCLKKGKQAFNQKRLEQASEEIGRIRKEKDDLRLSMVMKDREMDKELVGIEAQIVELEKKIRMINEVTAEETSTIKVEKTDSFFSRGINSG